MGSQVNGELRNIRISALEQGNPCSGRQAFYPGKEDDVYILKNINLTLRIALNSALCSPGRGCQRDTIVLSRKVVLSVRHLLLITSHRLSSYDLAFQTPVPQVDCPR